MARRRGLTLSSAPQKPSASSSGVDGDDDGGAVDMMMWVSLPCARAKVRKGAGWRRRGLALALAVWCGGWRRQGLRFAAEMGNGAKQGWARQNLRRLNTNSYVLILFNFKI
jgi:hypothetical protein